MSPKYPKQEFRKGQQVIGTGRDGKDFPGVVFSANWQPMRARWSYTVKAKHKEGEHIRVFTDKELRRNV
jgi:hypothetical protein